MNMQIGEGNMPEEKRGRGRPRKGEIVTKPVVKHTRADIKEKNKEKYAKQAINNAVKIYKKYDSPIPNPLNVDVKKITKEAREAWKYIFSLRGYTGEEAIPTERTFYSGNEVVLAFELYCAYIRANNFMTAIVRPDGEPGVIPCVPSQTNFAKWLGCSRGAIFRAMQLAADETKHEYKTLLSDLLSEGAMMGVYNSGSTIFSLKNLCDWADKKEDRVEKEEFTPVEDAEKLLAELGYSRPKLVGK